jgi:hypothetical protein
MVTVPGTMLGGDAPKRGHESKQVKVKIILGKS